MVEYGPVAREVRAAVQQRVGAAFRNCSVDVDRTCAVCRAPAADELCDPCSTHREAFGAQLADRVAIFTYAQGWHPIKHQSAHIVRSYKEIPPVRESVQNMHLVVSVGTIIHGACIQAAVGSKWDSVTFVPSATRPGPEHPVAELARQVFQVKDGTTVQRFLIEIGPGFGSKSFPRDDMFVIPSASRSAVDGKHVLIVDDTWTKGTTMQSAAIAVKRAGARAVTALCVDRWLRWDWPVHRTFLESLHNPYDPFICPILGPSCERGASLDTVLTDPTRS
ncbi:phosphoribosyltransferase [Rhodococcus sp. WS4]|nr:phosphoribosyltransferase [Rhodococcus sp. WS4]